MEGNSLNLLTKIYNSTTIMDFGALFSDVTPQFVTPSEPAVGDNVIIKFRAARNNVTRYSIIIRLK